MWEVIRKHWLFVHVDPRTRIKEFQLDINVFYNRLIYEKWKDPPRGPLSSPMSGEVGVPPIQSYGGSPYPALCPVGGPLSSPRSGGLPGTRSWGWGAWWSLLFSPEPPPHEQTNWKHYFFSHYRVWAVIIQKSTHRMEGFITQCSLTIYHRHNYRCFPSGFPIIMEL